MNHYDILGIRPSASEQEIELAYKGRRSQYHPDKYAESDTDTLKWATDQMQAVNKAYAVLSDPQLRSQYDEALGLGKDEHEAEESDSTEHEQAPAHEEVVHHEEEQGVAAMIKAMTLKQKLVWGYFTIALIVGLYGSMFGANSHKGLAFNLGSAIVWPAVIFPALGYILGGILLVVLFLVFMAW